MPAGCSVGMVQFTQIQDIVRIAIHVENLLFSAICLHNLLKSYDFDLCFSVFVFSILTNESLHQQVANKLACLRCQFASLAKSPKNMRNNLIYGFNFRLVVNWSRCILKVGVVVLSNKVGYYKFTLKDLWKVRINF